MNRLFPLLALVLLSISASACGMFEADQIRAEGEKYTETVQADQYALNQIQQRQIKANQHAYDMAKEAYWRQVWDSALVTVKTTANITFAALGVALMGLTLSFAYTIHKTTRGMGEAAERAAWVHANLIYVDHKTGQFPVFLYEGHGRYAMVLPGVAGVIPLDTRHEPDRQMIATQGAALQDYLIAREAAKSEDPAGVSVVRAQTIDVTPEMTRYAEVLRNDSE